MSLYEAPCFTFRFSEARIIPRFQLEGVEAGRWVEVFKIDAGTGERLGLLATAALDAPSNAGVSNVLEVAFAIYERQFTEGTAALTVELGSIEEELEGIALALPKQVRNPTIYDRLSRRADELEARKKEILPRLAPLTGRARTILEQLRAIKATIESTDQVKRGRLLDSFLERVEPVFDVKEVGRQKKRRTEVVGFRFVPKETAKNVLPGEMKIEFTRRDTSVFHFVASIFSLGLRYETNS